MARWKMALGKRSEEKQLEGDSSHRGSSDLEGAKQKPPRWSLGILQDKQTDEVPGSVLLMSKVSERNEPLGLQHVHARTSASSLPSPYPPELTRRTTHGSQTSRRSKKDKPPEKKLTADGTIILDPQPDDSLNDPLNWPAIRRDLALLSLGLYCMLGGGMTPVLAAGFSNVAETYHISTARVALTTGLYMMGLGIGSVIMSPTAILYGKRPVYLFSATMFIVTSVWCAVSPNFISLIFARIFMGIAVSPVECLPSATIAEIFFLHERAYRLGIYTLLLLGGKNLIPLVSAVIINSQGWRWVFWVVAMVVGLCAVLLFLFVPETFWDRTPRPRRMLHRHEHHSDSRHSLTRILSPRGARHNDQKPLGPHDTEPVATPNTQRTPHARHVGFADGSADSDERDRWARRQEIPFPAYDGKAESATSPAMHHDEAWKVVPSGEAPPTPLLHNLNSPYYVSKSEQDNDYFSLNVPTVPEEPSKQNFAGSAAVPPARNQEISDGSCQTATEEQQQPATSRRAPGLKLTLPPKALSRNPSVADHSVTAVPETAPVEPSRVIPSPDAADSGELPEKFESDVPDAPAIPPSPLDYTSHHREAPPKSYLQTLRPYSGRLSKDKWWKVAVRPFILFAYPSILWSAMVYSLSVGWLIVLSESVTVIYRERDSYNFTALQVGLVYLSPFIGGVLGTAVAGKVSDLIVRAMARRNDGIYEPEFRLVMAVPIAITTVVGLMGFGWSAEEHDMWFVPTFFFGVISFGCCLGSTTAITFAVDCYRGYAGEALVTLNFSKNIFHGLVFSLFFTEWLEADGAKEVFLIVGGIQLALMFLSIPMYIFGKRARMWTVRKDLMERF